MGSLILREQSKSFLGGITPEKGLAAGIITN
jgi:hypothetical protein